MSNTLGKVVADFSTTLNLKTAIGATSATLDSATDDDGVALPTGTYFLTLDRKSANKEYIKCTLTGTALTDIYHVSRQGVLTSGTTKTHRKGATVEITDFAIIKKMLDLLDGTNDLNASVPLKYDGTATISNANHLATKAYVDDVAIAGGADASTTVKGISKLSVAPASASNPIAVGDNDGRVPTQDENDALAGTSGTPSSSNKYVTADDVSNAGASGKVVRLSGTSYPAGDGSAITGIATLDKMFGTGADGAVIFDGSTTILGLVPAGSIYTMTRDIHCTDITINVGVTIKPAGYRIYATGTTTNNGTISNNGGNGGNATNSTASTIGTAGAAGVAATAGVTVFGTAQAGTIGANGRATSGNGNDSSNPSNTTNAVNGIGGPGGAGGNTNDNNGGGVKTGGAGGTSTAATSGTDGVKDLTLALTFYTIAGVIKNGTGGSGGGGGALSYDSAAGTDRSGSGGGGGGAGGVVFIATKNLAGNGAIQANGGAGGNGGNGYHGTGSNNTASAGGGGGGGGAGGTAIVITKTAVNPNTLTASGGAGGTGGANATNGTGTATTAATGSTGTTGQSVYFVI